MIDFLRERHPDALMRTRVEMLGPVAGAPAAAFPGTLSGA